MRMTNTHEPCARFGDCDVIRDERAENVMAIARAIEEFVREHCPTERYLIVMVPRNGRDIAFANNDLPVEATVTLVKFFGDALQRAIEKMEAEDGKVH
jgi:hypothetical protein